MGRARPASTPLDLVVVGHTNIDAEVRVPRLPAPDRTTPVLTRRESLGGTGANIARWSAHLGLRVALASFVGPDLPRRFRELLRRDRVETRDLLTRPGEFSPVCWIFEDGQGGQTTVIDQGAMRSTRDLALPRGSVDRGRLVHLTTGDPSYQLRVARYARERGKLVAFDPAQEVHYRWSSRELRSLLPRAEILFGNEHEVERAAELAGVKGGGGLVELVPLVVMTRGARGARAYSRNGTVDVPSPRVRDLHRVTGAGDAFRAGFYRGWFGGEPLSSCLAFGAAAGATAVARPPGPDGALPSAATVRRWWRSALPRPGPRGGRA